MCKHSVARSVAEGFGCGCGVTEIPGEIRSLTPLADEDFNDVVNAHEQAQACKKHSEQPQRPAL